MLVSELIKACEGLKERHGDIEINYHDSEYGETPVWYIEFIPALQQYGPLGDALPLPARLIIN